MNHALKSNLLKEFPHDAVLPVAVGSTNPAEHNQEKRYVNKSTRDRQSVGEFRHEKRIENAPPPGLPRSVPTAPAELLRLRDVAGGSDEIRRDTGGQNGGAKCPEHQPKLLGSHPHGGHDHEGRLTLFRVWFSDGTAMLIDATDKEHAAELGQAWSLKWDRLDPRRVVNVTKL